MTLEEAMNSYIIRFGGFPYFLFQGVSDEQMIIKAIENALETGEEINALVPDADY